MTGSLIIQDGVLVGKLRPTASVKAKMKQDSVLHGYLSLSVMYEDYLGSYNVVPETNNQTLATADKHMLKDVTVESIPYHEVSNPQGGLTVIIGGVTNGS